MAKFEGWKWTEGSSGDVVYQSKKGRVLVYGFYSTDGRIPYSSRVHYVEVDKKMKLFDSRSEAKAYAFDFMKRHPNG